MVTVVTAARFLSYSGSGSQFATVVQEDDAGNGGVIVRGVVGREQKNRYFLHLPVKISGFSKIKK